MSDAVFDILRKVTTATITTMLLKKGIRRCWMNGPKPLVPNGERLIGPAFTLRFVPVREDLGDTGKLGQSDFDPCRNRRDAGRRDRRRRCHGRTERGHFRRHPLRAHEEAKRHGAGDRRRPARPHRRAGERAAGLVRRGRGAGLGQRIDLRRLAAADRLRGCAIFPGDVIVVDDDGAVVIPQGMVDFVAHEGAEHELYESWVFSEVEKGVKLPGLYPPNDEAKARYAAWRKSRS